MDDPSLLNERTQGELKEILDEFPYFQTAHLLYARNLMNENNFRYSGQLKTCAIYATDRAILYHLLHPKQEKPEAEKLPELEVRVKENEPEAPALFELAEETPITETKLVTPEVRETRKRETTSFDLISFEPGEMGYKLEGSETESEISLSELANDLRKMSVKKNQTASKEEKEELIERFIRENPIMQPRTPVTDSNEEQLPPLDEEHKESDDFITETLARIYLKQGFYQKAIKAFQRLSLKYPEKSIYFARQIEEITKLLNK